MTNETKNKRIPLHIQMLQLGFNFIITHENIADTEKYRKEHGIEVLNSDKELKDYQARIIYNNDTKQIVNLREEK